MMITTVEDITIKLTKEHFFANRHIYMVTKEQRGTGLFHQQHHVDLGHATRHYLDCVANEIALHADGVDLSGTQYVITIPQL